MAIPAATTLVLTVKKAICPTCGDERIYYLDGTSKPIPLTPPNTREYRETRVLMQSVQATAATRNTIEDSGAAWTVDEHKGKTIEIMGTDRGDPTQRRKIESNTSTVLTIGGYFKKDNSNHKATEIFETLPYFKIVDESIDNDVATVKTNLRDSYHFVCPTCNTKYSVDKP